MCARTQTDRQALQRFGSPGALPLVSTAPAHAGVREHREVLGPEQLPRQGALLLLVAELQRVLAPREGVVGEPRAPDGSGAREPIPQICGFSKGRQCTLGRLR